MGQVRSLEQKLVEKPKDELLAAMEEKLSGFLVVVADLRAF